MCLPKALPSARDLRSRSTAQTAGPGESQQKTECSGRASYFTRSPRKFLWHSAQPTWVRL
jgi:hypothetical protein